MITNACQILISSRKNDPYEPNLFSESTTYNATSVDWFLERNIPPKYLTRMRILTLYESVIFGELTYSATTVDRLIQANDSCESVLFSESTIYSATSLTFMSQFFVKQTHFTHQSELFTNRKLLLSSCMTGNESNCSCVLLSSLVRVSESV